jgi:glycosyltransferase involved in cell wall biosynthesis
MKNNTNNRPRVLVMTSTFPRWENDSEPAFIYELSRRLTSAFDITVLSPHSPGSARQERMAGLRVIRFPYFLERGETLAMHGGGILNKLKSNPINYLLVPFFLIGQLIALVHLLHRERFDIIHAHWLIPQGLTAVLGLIIARQRIPLLCTSHGGDLFALRGKILQLLKRLVMDRSRALTVVSRAMRHIVIDMGVNPDKVQVISMGVDLRNRFIPDPGIKRSNNELLFVGRLVEKKGVRILVEAMPEVIAHHPEAYLTVAGAGPLERELRNLAEQLRISDRVHFLGMVMQEKLPELYQRAAIAVFPFVVAKSGDQEGFGLVQVEAMGCECPVIAGDLPVVHDIITNEETGLLVPLSKPEVLATAILRVLNDSDLCVRITRQARKRVVEQFDWEVVASKYAKLIKKLVCIE